VEASEFWLVLLMGVVIGMLLSMAMRWVGRKLLARQKAADTRGDRTTWKSANKKGKTGGTNG